jgi:hypothetical protein
MQRSSLQILDFAVRFHPEYYVPHLLDEHIPVAFILALNGSCHLKVLVALNLQLKVLIRQEGGWAQQELWTCCGKEIQSLLTPLSVTLTYYKRHSCRKQGRTPAYIFIPYNIRLLPPVPTAVHWQR